MFYLRVCEKRMFTGCTLAWPGDLREFPSQWGVQWFIVLCPMSMSKPSRVFERLNASFQRLARIHVGREGLRCLNQGRTSHLPQSCRSGKHRGTGNDRGFLRENVAMKHEHRCSSLQLNKMRALRKITNSCKFLLEALISLDWNSKDII